jgi:prepilin-type N-terminal cleavage/methylation domain-containing protein
MKKYQKGLTLIEVLVAVIMLLILINAVGFFFIQNQRTAVINQHRRIATQYASEAMETLRQIRDTAWVDQTQYNNPSGSGLTIEDDWKKYLLYPVLANTYGKVGNQQLNCVYEAPLIVSLDNSCRFNIPDKSRYAVYLEDGEETLAPVNNPQYTRKIFIIKKPLPIPNPITGDEIEKSNDAFIKILIEVVWHDYNKDYKVSEVSYLTNWKSF